MRAWEFSAVGDPGVVVKLVELPTPVPGPGQVLVRVLAAAVNYSDLLVVRGTYQATPALPAVAGMELAGVVVGGDPGSQGSLVAGLTSGLVGAFAEYAVLDFGSFAAAPSGYSAIEAACFPVAFQTSWFALHVRGQVRAGEAVLVHAASGGVGSAAVQLASAAGARAVIGVIGHESKRDLALKAGCTAVVHRDDPDVVSQVKAASGGAVDVVVDPVGGEAHRISERVVGFDGRIVIVGFASGTVPPVRADLAMVKNYSVVGLHWGLYRERAPEVVSEQHRRLVQVVAANDVRPLVTQVFDFERVPEALAHLASGRSTGRVAIDVRA